MTRIGVEATTGSESENKATVLARRTRILEKGNGVCLLLLPVNLSATKIPGRPAAAPGTHSPCSMPEPPRYILLPAQCPQGTEREGQGQSLHLASASTPRSSGGHSPSGKGGDATGGNAVSLGQQRALHQVPVK